MLKRVICTTISLPCEKPPNRRKSHLRAGMRTDPRDSVPWRLGVESIQITRFYEFPYLRDTCNRLQTRGPRDLRQDQWLFKSGCENEDVFFVNPNSRMLLKISFQVPGILFRSILLVPPEVVPHLSLDCKVEMKSIRTLWIIKFLQEAEPLKSCHPV